MGRLKLARRYSNELDDQAGLLEDKYSKIDNSIDLINDACDDINNDLGYMKQENDFEIAESYVDNIVKRANEIYSDADNIQEYTAAAKDCGIYNESQLKDGNVIISEVEAELENLRSEADSIARENQDHDDGIEKLLDDIQEAEDRLNDLDLEMHGNIETGGLTRLRRIMARNNFPYICAVHDDIISLADDIKSYASDIETEAGNLDSYISGDEDSLASELESFANDLGNEIYKIQTLCNHIQEDMKVGLDMNSRMYDGIERKNTLISELRESINEVEKDVDSLRNEGYELADRRAELENALADLEEQIANM